MALISKASLLMVPSTYEQEKLYNVLPSGNRAPDNKGGAGYDQTRADFTFDRGSNAAATRIGSDGLIKKYRENKLLQSNQFDTTWANSDTTETSGQSGYDGTNNAWLLTKSAADGYIYQNISQSGVQTYSVYLKANALNWARVQLNGSGADKYAYFDLANGVIGGSGSGNIDENIESIGNGWYRCSIVADTTSTRVRIYPAQADNDVSGTTGSIYIQNAQLESGLVATDVLTSGATTAKAGVLIDLPRINYDANGENGSLLLEPSRSNLVQYSELGTDYSAQGGNLTNNETISPEGYTNAFKFLESSADSNHGFYETLTLSSNTYYAVSVFVKKLGRRYIGLQSWWSSTKGAIAYFDLDNVETKGTYEQGTNYSATNAKIEDYGNDWYRISAVFQSGETTHYYGVVSMDSLWTTGTSYTNTYTGDISKGFYSYGLQVELGSYSTSYIPNHGTTGGVTRAADSCLDGGSAESINSTEGVLYAEISALAEDVSFKTICLHDGTNTQRINIWYWNDGTFKVDGHNNNVQQFDFDFAADLTALNKIAVKYKANDFSVFLNGSKINSDTSGATPIGLNTLDFRNGNNLYPFYGNVKQVAVFNEALSDSELATLTTL